MTTLLSSSHEKDLKVLYLLITTSDVSYTYISEQIGVTVRNGKEIVKRLNNTIEEVFDLTSFILSNNKGKIYINSKYDIQKFEILYTLRLHWYKDEVPMKLINKLIENHELSTETAQNNFYISGSGLKKKIYRINEYLKQFSFKIITHKGNLKFAGDEANIRIFLFNFIYYTYYNIEWPFDSELLKNMEKNIYQDDLVKINKYSSSRGRALTIMISILDFRYSSNSYINNTISDEVESILKLLEQFYESNETLMMNSLLFTRVPIIYKKKERLFAELFLRAFVPEIDSKEIQEKIGHQFSILNTPITRLSNYLIKKLDDKFLINGETSQNLRIFQLVIFITISKIMGKSFLPLISMRFPKPTYQVETDDKLRDIIRNFIQSYENYDNYFINIVSDFLCNMYNPFIIRKLYLHLEFSGDLKAPFFIKNRIFSIFNSDYIVFTQQSKQADLIITDTFDIQKDPEKTFYLSNTNDNEGWKNLMKVIQKISFKKIGLMSKE